MRRRKALRDPAFIEVEGQPYINLGFEGGRHVELARQLGLRPGELWILVRLSGSERDLLMALRADAEVEAWARLSVMVRGRRRG